MAILQKQIMQEKEAFLKKNNIMSILKKFFIFFILFLLSFGQLRAQSVEAITKYIQNLNDFSSSFIQTEEINSSEGRLYVKNERIKIEYLSPNNIEIIISKNKGMYFNKDLKEVEFFNPKDSVGEVFFAVFFDPNFFIETEIFNKEGHSIIIKKISIDKTDYKVSIYFEKKPLKIRKIKIYSEDYEVNLGIYNINLYANLEANFFSMINPLIN